MQKAKLIRYLGICILCKQFVRTSHVETLIEAYFVVEQPQSERSRFDIRRAVERFISDLCDGRQLLIMQVSWYKQSSRTRFSIFEKNPQCFYEFYFIDAHPQT